MAKNNEKVWRTLRFSLVIAGILVSIALAYGALNHQVEDNTATIEKHETELDEHQTALTKMGKDVEHIKATVDRIEKKM